MTPVREALEEIIGLLDNMAALHPSRDLREVLPDPKGLADRARLLLSAAPGEPCAVKPPFCARQPAPSEARKDWKSAPEILLDQIAAIRDGYQKLRRDCLDQMEWNAAQGNSEEAGEFSTEAERHAASLLACNRILTLVSNFEALSPSGGDDSEVERLRDALSLALQYIPAQPTDSDAAKDIERVHDLIAGRAKARDERSPGGDKAKESKGGVPPFGGHGYGLAIDTALAQSDDASRKREG